MDNSSNESVEQKAAFTMNDDRTLALIGLHWSANLQVDIEKCNTAHDAWTKFKVVYEPKSRVCIMSLRKEFFHLQMKSNENISSFSKQRLKQLLAEHPESYESLNMSLASLSNEKSTKFWGNYKDSTREYDRQADEANIYKEALHMIKKSDRRPNTEMTKYKTEKDYTL